RDAVDEADHHADREQREDAEVRAPLRALAVVGDRDDEPRRDHRRETEGRLERQVHPADHDDQRLAHDHDPERRDLLPDLREIRRREEDGADERADDQEHDDHRQECGATYERRGGEPPAPIVEQRPELHCARRRLTDLGHRSLPAVVSPSVAAISSSSSNGGSLNSVNTCPRTRITTRSQICRSSNSSLARSRLAPVLSVRSASAASRSSFDATSTPRVGVIATTSFGRLAAARATVTFCWFPPDRSPAGWFSPRDTSDSWSASGRAARVRADGLSTPSGPARRRLMLMVMFSAQPSWPTNPSSHRSSGM